MLHWNRLIKTADKVQLEIVSSLSLKVVQSIQTLCLLIAMGLLAFSLYQFFQKGPFDWLPIIIGAAFLFLSNLIKIAYSMLKRFAMQYIFDLSNKTLYIEYAQVDYDFLPKTILFSQIASLRLLNLKPRDAKAGWQLELIMDDGKFYPLTAFKNEQKARKIVQELQQVLHCSFRESMAPEQSFKDYKQSFLQQFKP